MKDRHPSLFVKKHNVGVFSWEFEDYFYYPDAFTVIDEVLVFTDFIATAIKKAAPQHIKITKLNFPFVENWQITKRPCVVRKGLNIKESDFVFFFNFDFLSVYERKNPEAIIKAFHKAFYSDEDVRLVLKTIHANKNNHDFKKLKVLIENTNLQEKVILLNENMTRNEFMSLMNAVDVYISLHRSEGIGLGMMEAMAIGKPVIATGYGGNLEFMNKGNSLLVDYRLVPVSENAKPYKGGWLWADANTEQATGYMRRLYLDRDFTLQLGKKAQNSILEKYNQETFMLNLKKWMNNTYK